MNDVMERLFEVAEKKARVSNHPLYPSYDLREFTLAVVLSVADELEQSTGRVASADWLREQAREK